MITLHQFPPALGLRNPSPFCLKAELALALSGLPHQLVEMPDPRQAPLGKLPYIDDDGVPVADSERILVHLRDRHGFDLDARLSPRDRGIALAVTRLAEEHLYWLLVASRWFDDAAWPTLREVFFGTLPFFLRPILVPMVRGSMRRTYRGHGLGLHSLEEQQAFARRDLQALADMLGDDGLLFDDRISSGDLAAYCVLDGILRVDLPSSWLREIAVTMPRLAGYLDEFDAAFERATATAAD